MKEVSEEITENQYKNGQEATLHKKVKKVYLMVGLGFVVLFFYIAVTVQLNVASQRRLESTMYLNQYRLGSKQLTASVQSYAATGDKSYYDNYMKELNEDKNRDIAWEGLKQENLKDEEWAQLEHIASLSNGLVPLEEEAMEKVDAGDMEAARNLVFGGEYDSTIQEINAATDVCISTIQTRMSKIETTFNVAMYASMVAFLVIFLMIVFRALQMSQYAKKELLQPILKVGAQIKLLAQGNFENVMDLEEDDSEVGAMVTAIHFMQQNYRNMVSEISQILEQMGQGNYLVEPAQQYVGEFKKIEESLQQISAETRKTLVTIQNAAKEIGSGAEQLAQSATDLAEGCTTQASKISETSSRIDQMAKSMEEKAQAAKETAQISTQAGVVLEEGNKKMQELKAAIGEISKRSEEIRTIIEVIEDIAGQTNLLSLNASIEAARAGEAGRGFAVVAEQVKNLAEQSTRAAGETTKLIESTVEAVNRGIVIAEDTEKNLSEIMEGAKAATDKMICIADELQKEVEGVKEVDGSISNIAEIVDNNSAASQETAAVSEEQSAQVLTMVQLMEKFQV